MRPVPVAIRLDRARRLPRGALEALLLAGLYFSGELARGLARAGEPTADANATTIVRLERRLHVFDEAAIQRAAGHVGGLPTLLGYAYVSLHLAGSVAVLIWVYRRRRDEYARLRNTLALASGLAIAGYALFPTAPPRLAGIGMKDTVSSVTAVDLHSTLVSSLYNPYAAVPSVHIVFSVIVGVAVVRLARRPLWRVAGAVYPVFVLFVIVATGNHFFFDAAAGAAVAMLTLGASALAPRLRSGLQRSSAALSTSSGPRLMERDRGADVRPGARRAVDLDRPRERIDAVPEPDQPGAASLIRSANAVVSN